QRLTHSEREPRGEPPQQQGERASGMSVVVDCGNAHSCEHPAPCVQPGAKVQFLAGVQIAIGQISNGLDGGAAINSAAIQTGYRSRLAPAIVSAGALRKFEIAGFALNDDVS